MEGRVVRISIAPVKALHLVHLEEVELTAAGVVGDRRFWLVDAAGRLANVKRIPRLTRVGVEWDEATRRLALSFDEETVEGIVEPGDAVEAILYDETHPSRAVPGPWQEALSDYAGQPLTLLWSERGAVDRGALRGGWASILSSGSLERLREEAGEAEPVDGRRFRMLFEIAGVRPHAEDEWIGRRVTVGGAVVEAIGNVGRCAVTTRNPDSGELDLDTLRVLTSYRPEGQTERLPFGIWGNVVQPGRVRLGDPVVPA